MLITSYMLLNNQWVKEEIKREIKKYVETNENRHITYQNLEDIAKVVLRGKFVAINSYIKKKESSQINNLNFILKQRGKNVRVENKEIEKRKINDTENKFFENINEIDELLVRLSKKKGEKTQKLNQKRKN